MVELKDTIPAMLSDDYKERFKAEYQQTKIRYRKLVNFCERIEVAADYLGVEPPKHDCPRALLEHQLSVMSEYLFTLQKRAIIEGIDLDTLED